MSAIAPTGFKFYVAAKRRDAPFEKAVRIILDTSLNDRSGIGLRHRLEATANSVQVIDVSANAL
jgi:hypothetical protein